MGEEDPAADDAVVNSIDDERGGNIFHGGRLLSLVVYFYLVVSP